MTREPAEAVLRAPPNVLRYLAGLIRDHMVEETRQDLDLESIQVVDTAAWAADLTRQLAEQGFTPYREPGE